MAAMHIQAGRWLTLMLLQLLPCGQSASDDCSLTDKRTKVACIGASITKGVASAKPYPQQLAEILGPKYCVANFGIPGTTVLKRSKNPYWKYHSTIKRIMALRPDVIVMQFGANDSKEKNVHADFRDDYVAMVKLFKQAPSRPSVYIMAAPPIFSLTAKGSRIYGMDAHVVNALQASFERIANESHIAPPVSVFNAFRLHCPDLHRKCAWMTPDGVHPNVHGDKTMARLVYSAITGDSHCFMPFEDRKDCGFEHITEAQCHERGCCYRPSAMDGTPWCFNRSEAARLVREDCEAADEQKTQCGSPELEEHECRARGCCWRESASSGTPACFHRVPGRWIETTTSSTTATVTTTATTTTSTTGTSTTTSSTTSSSTTSTTGTSTTTTSTTSTTNTTTTTTTTTSTTTTTTLPLAFIIVETATRAEVAPYVLAVFGAVVTTLVACHAVIKCCGASRKPPPQDQSGGEKDSPENGKYIGQRQRTTPASPGDEMTPLIRPDGMISTVTTALGAGSPGSATDSMSPPSPQCATDASPARALQMETAGGSAGGPHRSM